MGHGGPASARLSALTHASASDLAAFQETTQLAIPALRPRSPVAAETWSGPRGGLARSAAVVRSAFVMVPLIIQLHEDLEVERCRLMLSAQRKLKLDSLVVDCSVLLGRNTDG